MSSSDDNRSTGGGRRRHDASASRAALLGAARALFDERGFQATTVREIGVRAGTDPALIARYFGGKEGLYLAVLAAGDRPPLPAAPGDAIVRILSAFEQHGLGPIGLALVSPTLSESVRTQVRAIVEARAVAPLADALEAAGAPDARLRAEALVAIGVGVSVTRGCGTLETLAAAPLEDLVRVLRPLADALAASEASEASEPTEAAPIQG